MQVVAAILQVIGYIALALVVVWLLGDFFGKDED